MMMQGDRHTPDISPGGDARPRRSGWGILLRCVAVLMLVVLGGFVWFLTLVRSDEQKPSRNADGIVVLTGGSSRVSDALELLSNGYGKRLLISGVHRANGVSDIGRSLPDTQKLLTCCVDLDRSAINTRSNATETRRWASERNFKSLIVVTSNYHVPRARVELSHAMPDIDLIWYPVIGEKWRDEPWWTSGAAMRLLLSEYVKYVAAEIRVRLEDRGLDLIPDLEDQPAPTEVVRKPTTASTK
ncbi:YdcF family protein [Afipia sp. TerB]